MTSHTPALVSKHPQMGTTIFTVMSGLASETGAVNLGQGFPDFACDPQLTDAVNGAMQEGLNQYPPMTGIAPLREAVSAISDMANKALRRIRKTSSVKSMQRRGGHAQKSTCRPA